MQTPEHPHFRRTVRTITTTSGTKHREIWEPDEEARDVNKQLIEDIGWHVIAGADAPFRHATGGFPGDSPVNNIARHADNYHFFMTDLRDAYGSVDISRLVTQLVEYGVFEYRADAEELLRKYCAHPTGNGLLQGAPAAPLLFNTSCIPLDTLLGELADEYGATYTRYLDDLTFSSPQGSPMGRRKRRRILDIIEKDGWEVAYHKTRVEQLSRPVTITGLSLYKTGYWRLSPTLIRKVAAALDEFEAKLDEGTEPITTHDIGVIDGYHGVIVGGYDPRRGQPTKIERELIERYRDLRHRAAPLLAGCAIVDG